LTVEQQFNPALAIASAVTSKLKKQRQTTDNQNIETFFFRSLKTYPDRKVKLDRAEFRP